MHCAITMGERLEWVVMVCLCLRLGLGDDLGVYGLVHIRGMGEGTKRGRSVVVYLVGRWVMEHMVMMLYAATGLRVKGRV